MRLDIGISLITVGGDKGKCWIKKIRYEQIQLSTSLVKILFAHYYGDFFLNDNISAR